MKDAVTNATPWGHLKSRLVESGKLASVFVGHERHTWLAPDTSPYDPLQIDSHLDRLSRLVTRCLDLRKDVRELEILAVRAAAEYELFLLTAPLDERIERLGHHGPSRSVQAVSEAEAANKFKGPGALETGFARVSSGRAESLALEASSIKDIEAAIAKRWEHRVDFEKSYNARSTESGNAHNYAERATNLQRLLGRQIEEVLERGTALMIGLKTIYAWSAPPLPAPVTLAKLDDLALWLLDVERRVALLRQHEGTYEITIPLLQRWGRSDQPLVDSVAFERALAGETLIFELRPDLFWNEPIRLSGFGLAFGNRYGLIPSSGIDSVQTSDGFARLAARVEAPPQTYSDGVSRPRAQFFLGNVGAHSAGPTNSVVTGSPLTNLNPVGEWRLDLEPWIVWKDAGGYRLKEGVRREDVIRDLKVTLLFKRVDKAKVDGGDVQ